MWCKLILADHSVNFKAALDYIRKEYTKLIHVIINQDVIQELYQEKVVTLKEKKEMQRKEAEDRMEYLLDDIIIPSLEVEVNQKCISLIKVMKISDDTSLQTVASKLMDSLYDWL